MHQTLHINEDIVSRLAEQLLIAHANLTDGDRRRVAADWLGGLKHVDENSLGVCRDYRLAGSLIVAALVALTGDAIIVDLNNPKERKNDTSGLPEEKDHNQKGCSVEALYRRYREACDSPITEEGKQTAQPKTDINVGGAAQIHPVHPNAS